jgi:hypothetical protein
MVRHLANEFALHEHKRGDSAHLRLIAQFGSVVGPSRYRDLL